MTKTMRKVESGDTLVRHATRAYWSPLVDGETVTVGHTEQTHGGAYVNVYDTSGRHVFRGAASVRVRIAG